MNTYFFASLAVLATALATLVTTPARATCQKPVSLQEYAACTNNDALAAGKAMNAFVRQLSASRLLDKAAIARSQASFLIFAKDHCAVEASAFTIGGEKDQAPMAARACEARMYRGRVTQLQEIIKGFAG